MNDKIYLTADKIYNQEFKLDTKGYRPQEVDKFLDMVISDYNEFTSIITNLNQENKELEEEISRLKTENRKFKEILNSAKGENGISYNNVDLLRRISNLEKVVYSKDE